MTAGNVFYVPVQHAYGREAVKRGAGEWDARACVEGAYTWVEQQPDSDLGKVFYVGQAKYCIYTRGPAADLDGVQHSI